MTNTKRLGRYHNVPSNNNNNDKSTLQSHFSKLACLYKDGNKKPSFDYCGVNLFLETKAVHYKNYLQKLIKQQREQPSSSIKSNQDRLRVLIGPNRYQRMQQ